MSGIDVLAVMDGDIEGMELVLPRARGEQRVDLILAIEQMREARAAVAELIDAATVIEAKYSAASDGPIGLGLVNGDFFRLRSALLQVSGDAR